jgi:hypothetical protein
MNCADCALITMQDFALGLVSPSKLHSSLAMSLPVIYVGPRGSNVDEAIKEFNCGISLRGDETRKFVQFVLGISKDKNDHVLFRRNARKAFEAAYCDKIALDQFDQVLQVVKPH